MSHSETTDRSDASQADQERPSTGLPDPEEMSQEEIDEIEAERKRRLDPENRPEMAEVDNTHLEFDFETGELVDTRSEDGQDDGSDDNGSDDAPDKGGEQQAGRESSSDSDADDQRQQPSQGGLPPVEEMPQDEIEEIEAERKRRLDPENRPEMAEVDNTHREFDLERGEFVDSPSDDGEA